MTRLAVLVTSHERRDATLACFDALASQEGHDVAVTVHLVDAGSRDGTADAVRRRFPDVEVIERGPELFWNGGMRAAWSAARSTGPDLYLWLNDDTRLDPDALMRLLSVHRSYPDAIVVGATRDPDTGELTYSGVRREHPLRPLRFSRVAPDGSSRPVDTMNGNCVLVPAVVAESVGNLDHHFTHGMGDFDYGLRARRKGFGVRLAPHTVGTCAANPAAAERSVGQEISHLRSPKGLPPSEWRVFAWRWAGLLWPLYFVSPYLRRLARRVAGRSTP